MRILRLDLEKYGPFTGRSLEFSPDARLHVVYGPNEAGKSSALAAIVDLLFGFEHRARNDFLHDARELRVGARITGGDGTELSFRRRRGNKNTLLDEADAALPDDMLAPLLGGLSRDVFTRAFGLSTETLRSGAEEMLRSEGDLGATLFAAASGLKGLNDLRRDLEQEADGIFAPRASQNRRFYQALEQHAQAARGIRENELKAGDWRALNDRIQELRSRLDELAKLRREAVAECARLARLKRVAPCLGLIDDAVSALRALEPLPAVPAEFADDLRAHMAEARVAREAEERAGQALLRAREVHERIGVDAALLARADEIGELVTRSGACADSRRDLPRVQAEADQKGRALDQLAVRLGLAGRERLEQASPTDAAQAQVTALIAEGGELLQAQRTRGRAIQDLQEELEGYDRERAAQGHVVDPRPLQERLAALEPDLRRLEDLAAKLSRAEAMARDLHEEARKLSPPADVEALSATPLPRLTVVEQFREDLERLAHEAQDLNVRRQEAYGQIAELEREIASLATGGPVPSQEAIAEVRAHRDERWQGLRERLWGRLPDAAPGDLPGEVSAFERASDEADRMADAAARDAGRVAQHAVAVRSLGRHREIIDGLGRRAAKLEERQAAIRAEWAALWAAVTPDPRGPAEMAEWLRCVDVLFGKRQALLVAQEEIATLQRIEGRIGPGLAALASEAGAGAQDASDAVLLARGVDRRLKELSRHWEEARDRETRRSGAERRLGQLRLLEREGEARLAEWKERWGSAVPALGLAPEVGLEEAEAARLAWREVPGAIAEWEDRRRRVSGMERDIASFEGRLAALTQDLCPDVAGAPPDVAMQALKDRLEAARDARARKAEAAIRLDEARDALAEAEAERRRAEEAVATLAQALPAGTDLDAELERLTRRDRLNKELSDRRRQLVELGDGLGEGSLRQELVAFDPDAATARMAELQAEEERLDLELREVHSLRDHEERRREALQAGSGAEAAAQDKAAAESRLAAEAREWLLLKLGALLISAAVERHRESQEDPLMRRAGVLFATVTGGRFEGLAQDYDSNDQPHLVGRRAGGGTVTLGGMSEGTRDQLYLALRLAYLEDYARRARPVPFIGDDLFSTFDDERTANGLKVLAEIGGSVQPILFTHHERVAELARAALKDDVELLDLP